GNFSDLKDVTVLMIQRDERSFVPPYDGIVLEPGDLVIVAATRQTLADLTKGAPELLHAEPTGDSLQTGRQIMAEVMVRPESELVGRTLEEIGFRYRHHCVVLGIERRSRMLRDRITRMPLKDGD